MKLANLFADTPPTRSHELIEPLLQTGALTLERIVSAGHTTPPGEWYDQERDEWVILLRGSAGIHFEDERETIALWPGDYLLIPAHRRHRVEWTHATANTVWLALHFRND